MLSKRCADPGDLNLCCLRSRLLDIPKAQGEPGVQPDRVTDDVGREAVSFEGDGLHQRSLATSPPLGQLS